MNLKMHDASRSDSGSGSDETEFYTAYGGSESERDPNSILSEDSDDDDTNDTSILDSFPGVEIADGINGRKEEDVDSNNDESDDGRIPDLNESEPRSASEQDIQDESEQESEAQFQGTNVEEEEEAEDGSESDASTVKEEHFALKTQTLVEKDVTEFVTLVKDFKEKAADLQSRLTPVLTDLESGKRQTFNGVSLLEVKLHTMLSYLTNLTFFMLLKLHGLKVEGHPCVMQLVEDRIVLEKIKPLEQKLKYQIDKLVKAAAMQEDEEFIAGRARTADEAAIADPLKFKPNPAALLSHKGDADDAQEDEKSGVYRPPKLAPVHFEDEPRAKTGKLTQKEKEKVSRSRLLRDLRSQYDDRPEEMTAQGTGYGAQEVGASKEDERWTERETFEEENFVRLNLTREDKKLQKKLSQKGALLRFHDEFQALDEDFSQLSSLHKAVTDEDELKFGAGLVQKKNHRANEIRRKRKYEDAADLLQSVAHRQRHHGGKDEFGRAVKKSRNAAKKRR
ncbi:Sas10/Utp3/C1D family-domain-containing protein [Gaertneriomyces semiglobifer]|nr:Sas10/Utp3/C1D family-domain-containing protein [Gaertneriomyces semiglobifer]